MNLKLSSGRFKKWSLNLLYFTAPILAIFFGQLAIKVDWKVAGWVAIYAFYAAVSDYFKKLK